MHIALFLIVLCCFAGSSEVYARSNLAKSNKQCDANVFNADNQIISVLCVRGKAYQISYDRPSAKILLVAEKRKLTLFNVPEEYDPALVGAERLIGFLPESLQVYKERNLLISVSAIRTTSGSGGGQCGAGAEIYLNFIDVGKPAPKNKSKILISSCDQSIELVGQDFSSARLSGISAVQNSLHLHFMNYKKLDGSPTAVVAPDFAGLLFK